MARVLYVTTAYEAGQIQFPDWVRDMSYVDVFVLNPYRFELETTDVPTVRESFSYTSETGIGKDGLPFLIFRAYNETLRRSFRELLRWGSWDALIIDGLVSVAPLVGDRGLDFPRGLSWVVYRERPEDAAKLNDNPKWFQFRRRIVKAKLEKWHRLISEKSAEVVKESRPQMRTLFDELNEAS